MELESSGLGHTSSSSQRYIEAIRAPSGPVAAVLQLQLQQALTTASSASQLVPSMQNDLNNNNNNNNNLNPAANFTSNRLGARAVANHWPLALFAILVLINLLVILGNILVIVAVYASVKLRNVTNIFIVSLATADLLLGVLVLPYALVYEIWCRGWLVTDVWISTASILNLCAISIDRYVAVTRPVKYRSIMTNRRAKTIVTIVWLLSFIICFPPLLTEWRPSGAESTLASETSHRMQIELPVPEQLTTGLRLELYENYSRRRRGIVSRESIAANDWSETKTRRKRALEKARRRQRRRRRIDKLLVKAIRWKLRRRQSSASERHRVDTNHFSAMHSFKQTREGERTNGLPPAETRAGEGELGQFGGIIANATLASRSCQCCKLSFEIVDSRWPPLSHDEEESARIAEIVVFLSIAATGDIIPNGRRRRHHHHHHHHHLLVGGVRVASLANMRRASCCFSKQRAQAPEPLGILEFFQATTTTGSPIELRKLANTSKLQEMIRFPFGGNFIVLNRALALSAGGAVWALKTDKGLESDHQVGDGDHGAHKWLPTSGGGWPARLEWRNCADKRHAHEDTKAQAHGRAHGLSGEARRGRGILSAGQRRAEVKASSKQVPAAKVTSSSTGRASQGLADGQNRLALPLEAEEQNRPSVIDDGLARWAHSLHHARRREHLSRPLAAGKLGATRRISSWSARSMGGTSQLSPRRLQRRRLQRGRQAGRDEVKSFNHSNAVSKVHGSLNVACSNATAAAVASGAAAATGNELRSSASWLHNNWRDLKGGRSGAETKGEGARATQDVGIIIIIMGGGGGGGGGHSASDGCNQIVVVAALEPGQFGAHDSRTSSKAHRAAALETERKPMRDFISNRKNRPRGRRRVERRASKGTRENKGQPAGAPSETKQICARLVLAAAATAAAAEQQERANGAAASSSGYPTPTAFIIISDNVLAGQLQLSESAATTATSGDRISLVSQQDGGSGSGSGGCGGGGGGGNPKKIKSISAQPARRITVAGGGGQGRAGAELAPTPAISGGASLNEPSDHLGAASQTGSRNEQTTATTSEASRRLTRSRRLSLAAYDPQTAAQAAVGSVPAIGGLAQPTQHNKAANARLAMQTGQDGGRSAEHASLAARSSLATKGAAQTMGPKVTHSTNDLHPAASAARANKGLAQDDAHDNQFKFTPSFGRALAGANIRPGRQVDKHNTEQAPNTPELPANQRRLKRDNNDQVQIAHLSHLEHQQDLNLGQQDQSPSTASCVLFHDKTYVIYSALGSFYIPMLVMVFFYSRIYLVASRAQKAMQRGYMTTKWPQMQTSGGRGAGHWSRSSFKQTNCRGGGGGGLINGIGAARGRAQDGGPAASVLQESDRLHWTSASESRSHRDESSCSHAANADQICSGNSPERVTLRIHRRTEPPPAPAAHQSPGSPPTGSPGAISQQQQLINSYQSFEAQRSTQAHVSRQQVAAPSRRQPLVVGNNSASFESQQHVDEESSLIRLVSLEQQRILTNTGHGRARSSLERGVLSRKLTFLDKKRASLPPPISAISSRQSQASPPRLARAINSPVEIHHHHHHHHQPKIPTPPLPVEANESPVEPEVVATRINGPEEGIRELTSQGGGGQHHKTSTRRTISTCHKCGRERLRLSGRRNVAMEITQRCKSAEVSERSDRSNRPTIVVVSWNEAAAGGGGQGGHGGGRPHHSASATSHLLKCQAAAASQASRPSLPLVVASREQEENEEQEEEHRLMLDNSTLESCACNKVNMPSKRKHCKHHSGHKCSSHRRHRSGHTGSGLSLVANLPQQVRKQSIMLLSSLTTRSSETLRRLSMAAAHPLDSLMQTSKSRLGSRAATETGAHRGDDSTSQSECSDCSDSDGGHGSAPSSSSAMSANDDHDHDHNHDKTTGGQVHRRRTKKNSCKQKRMPRPRKLAATNSPASTNNPKRTLDDYLMAVAGIDTSSSDEDNQREDDDEDDDDDQGPDESESSSSSCSGSRVGGLTSMLRKENLMMIPSIQVVSPDEDEDARCSPAADAAGQDQQQVRPREEINSNPGATTTLPNLNQPKELQSQRWTGSNSSSSKSSARPDSGGHLDDLDSVDKKVKRTQQLPPSAGLHRQGGLYESATSQRQSIVSSVLDMGEFKSSLSASTSIKLNSDGPPSSTQQVQNKSVRHSPDLFRLLDVRSKRNKPPPVSLNANTCNQSNGQLVVVSRANVSPQQLVRTQVVPSGRRRGAKRTSRWHAKRLRAETKAAKTVAIIVGGFIFCWLPFFTAYLSRAIICSSPDCIPQTWLSLSIWLGYMNSAINPVIYGLFSADFRHAFKNIVCRCRLRGPVNVPRSNHLNHHIHHQVYRNHNQDTLPNHYNLGQQQQTSVVSALVGNTLKSIM